MIIGLIAISSREVGEESCRKTIDWAIANKEHIVAVDLAGSERVPIAPFAPHFLRAKAAGTWCFPNSEA